MMRALVLNAGLAWTAYQIGALRHLVVERGLRFDLCAGSGIGAMHAALVACGEFQALEEFWHGISQARLVRLNFRSTFSGPFTGAPQRRFVARHVSEERLRERGAAVLLNAFNLQTGREQIFEYPGSDLPLVDGIMAAVATPGLCPPIPYRGQQLAEGTFINGFLAEAVALRPMDEIYAVAACLPERAPSLNRYEGWRSVLYRAVEMNQAHDVREGVAEARRIARAASSFAAVQRLPERLAAKVADETLRARLAARIGEVYRESRFPVKRAGGARIHLITPSRPLGYPLWRFRKKELDAASRLGQSDARRVLAGAEA